MSPRRWSIVLVALSVLVLSAEAFRLSSTRLSPRYDEVAYIALARDFVREGGVSATVRCYLEGRCKEDNRPPLHQFLLVPVTDDSPRSFARSKLISHATVLLLLGVVFLVVRRMFSSAVAAACVVTLCLMPVLPDQAARLQHDPLYCALTFAAVCAMGAWQNRGFVAWLLVGALVGLAFLTKGSGHLLWLPLLAVSLYRHGAALARRPLVYAAAIGFVVVAFFLMCRNVKLWGSPFYNVNGRGVWLDQWRDVWALQLSPEWSNVGLGWYLHRHSVFELALKLGRGAVLMAGVFIYAAGVGFSWPVLRVITGLVLLALGAAGLRRRWRQGHAEGQAGAQGRWRAQARRAEVFAVLATLAFSYAALSLAAGGGPGAQVRYAFPYVVVLLPYAIDQARVSFWPRVRDAVAARWPHFGSTSVAAGLLAVVLGGRLVWAATTTAPGAVAGPPAWTDPRRYYAVEPRWHETSSWLSRALAPGERFALSFQSLYSTWDAPWPDTDPRWNYWLGTPGGELLRQMKASGVRKLLVDTADAGFSEYADKLSAATDAHGALAFLGWPRCFADGATPSRFLIYCEP